MAGNAGREIQGLAAPLPGRQGVVGNVHAELSGSEGEGVAVALVVRPAVLDRMIAGVGIAAHDERIAHVIHHRGDLDIGQGMAERPHCGSVPAVADRGDHRLPRQRFRRRRGEIPGGRVEKSCGKRARVARITVAEVAAIVVDGPSGDRVACGGIGGTGKTRGVHEDGNRQQQQPHTAIPGYREIH